MQYTKFKEMKISSLGFGAMRLPTDGGFLGPIDEVETEKMVNYAIEHGVNYFDTAWGYHGGQSEVILGKLLGKYPRDSYFLADKFPGYDLSNMDKVSEVFEEQLMRCNVDYFDFYMLHNVCEMNIDAYLNPEYGIARYLLKQKAAGRIRHLGFSAHGGLDVMERFLAEHAKDMEFCQIQLNYLDYEFQNAKEKLELLEKHGIPVLVMEPLRGGKIAALPPDYANRLKELRSDETIPAWAFRFIQSLPNIVLTLSGMSNFEQVQQNVATFEEAKPLTEREMRALLEIAECMVAQTVLPCTGCNYCVNHCPLELDIPHLLSLYNEHSFTGGGFLAPMALSALPAEKKPDACLACGACEAVCPQQIKISEAMADFAEKIKG